jgi:hypothetical protein
MYKNNNFSDGRFNKDVEKEFKFLLMKKAYYPDTDFVLNDFYAFFNIAMNYLNKINFFISLHYDITIYQMFNQKILIDKAIDKPKWYGILETIRINRDCYTEEQQRVLTFLKRIKKERCDSYDHFIHFSQESSINEDEKDSSQELTIKENEKDSSQELTIKENEKDFNF